MVLTSIRWYRNDSDGGAIVGGVGLNGPRPPCLLSRAGPPECEVAAGGGGLEGGLGDGKGDEAWSAFITRR